MPPGPLGLEPFGPRTRAESHRLLREALLAGDGRYCVHPGDIDWWWYHQDPRSAPDDWCLALDGTGTPVGVVYLSPGRAEANVFTPHAGMLDDLVASAEDRAGGPVEVDWVDDHDTVTMGVLGARGYTARPDDALVWFTAALDVALPAPIALPAGFTIRAVAGEHEADGRRQASHAAFASTMTPAAHLERYLGFMRSPAYPTAWDRVVIAPDGRVASFAVAWPDATTGWAQFEPVGTDPAFQRLGLGRALMVDTLHRLRAAGLATARVCTYADDDANDAFYRSCGFTRRGRLEWWRRA